MFYWKKNKNSTKENTTSYTKGKLMLILAQDRGLYTYAQTHQLGILYMIGFAFWLILHSSMYPIAHGEFMVCRKLCLSHLWSCNPVCSRLH